MAKAKKDTTQIRSIQELKVRYIRFCINNDLDETIPPQLQVVESDSQQTWLDNHVAKLQVAEIEGVRLARNRTSLVRDIANDAKAKRKTKNAIANTIVNVVVDMSIKARSFVPSCVLNNNITPVTTKYLETQKTNQPYLPEIAHDSIKVELHDKNVTKPAQQSTERDFGQLSFGLF